MATLSSRLRWEAGIRPDSGSFLFVCVCISELVGAADPTQRDGMPPRPQQHTQWSTRREKDENHHSKINVRYIVAARSGLPPLSVLCLLINASFNCVLHFISYLPYILTLIVKCSCIYNIEQVKNNDIVILLRKVMTWKSWYSGKFRIRSDQNNINKN